jgi:putative addiction module component (TIGR02574 family)
MDTASALQAFQSLPLEERLELLFQMRDQLLDDGWKPSIDDELKADLDRRWASHQANPGSGLTWEQVKAHVRRPR